MAPSSRSEAGDGRAHRRTEPGRTYQVPKRTAVAPRRTSRTPDTLGDMPRVSGRIGRFVLLASVVGTLIACTGEAAVSFDPTGPCTSDGAALGAYPDLEARLPDVYRDAPPEKVDSGRNCSAASVGSLAEIGYEEVRFAGATWGFGAERFVVLAVFSAPGLDAAEVADFYEQSARVEPRVEILAETEPTIVGRAGRRLDAKRVDRLQTVVVWPAAEPGVVNVVVSNDLPDERIQEAIDAFGDR